VSQERSANDHRRVAPSAPPWLGLVAVGATGVLVAIAVLWGQAFVRRGPELFLWAPPFVGEWQVSWAPGLLWAILVAVGLVLWWVPLVERLRWGWVLAGSWALSLTWSVVLQASEGWDSLYTVLGNRRAYLPTARSIDSPAEFLRTFVARLPDYPTHVKGHPPGATLAHWFFDTIGGGRSDVLTASFLLIAASAAPASLVALRRVAGEEAARRAAPFAGLAPAVVWIASSPDAMFMGVAAWVVACGAIAVTSGPRRAGVAGLCSGLLAGLSISFSYGAVLLLAPLWALAIRSLRDATWRPLVPAGIGLAVVPGLFVAAGFDWFDGLAATHRAYLAGVAPERPDRYFLLANLAVLAVSVGPAAVAGIARLRDRATWWLVGGALAGVLAANVSLMSKGEVERIWLPAVPFLVLGAVAFGSRAERRVWLGAQLAVALVLQLWLRTPW
jgi:hypothetical protein